MSKFLLFLCLLATLTGGLTRQAEAALDLARSLDERGDDARVETEDGGVGDDELAAVIEPGPVPLTELAVLGIEFAARLGSELQLPLLACEAGLFRLDNLPIPLTANQRRVWLQSLRN